jgi:hypothetical protein
MVSVLASSEVDRVFKSRSCQTKDYAIAIYCFSASKHHQGVRAKTGWLGIGLMCPSGATCPSANCCFNKLALKRVGVVQSGPHNHHIGK